MQREPIIAARHVTAEIDAQSKLAGLQRMEVLLDQFIQLIRENLDARTRLQILQSNYARQRLVASRFRQQGNVIACALIAIRSTEIDDSGTSSPRGEFRRRQIRPCIDDFHTRNLKRPIGHVRGNNQNSHQFSPNPVPPASILHRLPKGVP